MCTLHILKQKPTTAIQSGLDFGLHAHFFPSIPAVRCCCSIAFAFWYFGVYAFIRADCTGLVWFSSIWVFTFKCDTSHRHTYLLIQLTIYLLHSHSTLTHSLARSLTISIKSNEKIIFGHSQRAVAHQSRNNHIELALAHPHMIIHCKACLCLS